MEEEIDSPFYTVKEVSVILRVNKVTIYQWIKEGKFKTRRIGRNWLIDKNTVVLDSHFR